MEARLISDGPAAGDWNMAVDEALLGRAESGDVCLRFYAWSSATLSLGYFQQHADREGHAPSRPLPMVRRSTGGGAIVHDRELTYSFTTPISERFSDAPQQLVARFHEALRDVLRDWGIATELCGPAAAERSSRDAPFLCFQRRATEDLICQGHKIMGSAQRRHHGALLQHGSILIARSPHAPELPGLSELAPRALQREALQDAWTERLTEVLGRRFTPDELTPEEATAAAARRAARFAHPQWTERR